MATTYTIRSIKGTETVTGTAEEAVRAALAHDAEMQPGFGTSIEISRGGVAGWEVLSLGDRSGADEIEELRSEAEAVEDWAQVELCDKALDEDVDGAARIRVLAQILSTHVEAALA